jgi:hypothetical protein
VFKAELSDHFESREEHHNNRKSSKQLHIEEDDGKVD